MTKQMKYEHAKTFPTRCTERTLLNHWIQLENCKFLGKTLRIREDGRCDGKGGWDTWTHFKVVAGGKGTVTLWNAHWKTCLRTVGGSIAGGGEGGPDCQINIIQNPKDPGFAYLRFANVAGRLAGVGVNDSQQGCLAGFGAWSRFRIHVVGNAGDGQAEKFAKERDEFETQRNTFNLRYKAYKDEYADYQSKLKVYQNNITQLQQQQGVYQQNIQQYRVDIGNLQQQQGVYQQNMQQYRVDMGNLQTQQQSLQQQNTQLKQREQVLMQNTQRLQAQLQDSKDKLAAITAAAQNVVNLCMFEKFSKFSF